MAVMVSLAFALTCFPLPPARAASQKRQSLEFIRLARAKNENVVVAPI